MIQLIIIFAVLLASLTIISAIGGGVRTTTTEFFYEDEMSAIKKTGSDIKNEYNKIMNKKNKDYDVEGYTEDNVQEEEMYGSDNLEQYAEVSNNANNSEGIEFNNTVGGGDLNEEMVQEEDENMVEGFQGCMYAGCKF